MRREHHWKCDAKGCTAEHVVDMDEPRPGEVPLGWIYVSVSVGDEERIGQDVDLNGEAFLYFCDGCQNDVLKALCEWRKR